MVFGFMRQSSGHITVYSEVGHGTTFRLYLPRVTADGEAKVPEKLAVSEHGGHETVLAVEDNVGLRRVVARQLGELGYHVLEAEDGNAALKVLESEPVNLLFTDIMMPGGFSGYDLALKATSRWPDLKVLLTSGYPETKLNGNGGPPVSMQLLNKPYRKSDLALAVRKVLDANDVDALSRSNSPVMLLKVPKLMTARKVLVIDDEEAFCLLMARMLSEFGYKVLTATRAKSAHLDDMTESDIIFIDMNMPEMDGMQVLDFLFSHQIKSSIVLMSGAKIDAFKAAEQFAKRVDLRLIGVLDKPFRESDVRAILEAD